MAKSKGLVRSLNRQGSVSGKLAPAERSTGRLREPSACERCGALFRGRVWRRSGRVPHALLGQVTWTTCPACRQTEAKEGYGRIVMRGSFVAPHEGEIRARIDNVVARAGFTQPERRLVSIDRARGGLDVITTSQRLAHRIVHELKKAFRGRASYLWSDDGTLYATWERDERP